MKKVIFVIALITLIFSLVQIINYIGDAIKTKNMYENISEIYHHSEGHNMNYHDEDTHKNNKLNKLKEINPDIIGWISIPNTKIDYPIVQGKDNDYYLDHNLHGEQDRHGAIFLDSNNDPKYTENLVIYGHNMRDGTMFKSLEKYKDKDFFRENRFLNLNLNNNYTKYEIFSVYAEQDSTLNLQLSFNSTENYRNYFNRVKEKSLYPTDVSFQKGKTMLTLSTCTYEIKDGRLVLHAYPVE